MSNDKGIHGPVHWDMYPGICVNCLPIFTNLRLRSHTYRTVKPPIMFSNFPHILVSFLETPHILKLNPISVKKLFSLN